MDGNSKTQRRTKKFHSESLLSLERMSENFKEMRLLAKNLEKSMEKWNRFRCLISFSTSKD